MFHHQGHDSSSGFVSMKHWLQSIKVNDRITMRSRENFAVATYWEVSLGPITQTNTVTEVIKLRLLGQIFSPDAGDGTTHSVNIGEEIMISHCPVGGAGGSGIVGSSKVLYEAYPQSENHYFFAWVHDMKLIPKVKMVMREQRT